MKPGLLIIVSEISEIVSYQALKAAMKSRGVYEN